MRTLKQLYQDAILDHAKVPRCTQLPNRPTHRAEGYNALCGDKVEIGLVVDENETILEIGVRASACSICVASGSIMAEAIIGKTAPEIRETYSLLQANLDPKACQTVGQHADATAVFAGISEYPTRKLCVQLPWTTLADAWPKGLAPTDL